MLTARRSDGTWSAPSAILLHTGALDFLVGVDVYDALVIINSPTALAALRSGRCTLGVDVATEIGPLVDEGEVLRPAAPPVYSPLWTYLKSRRYHVNVPIDGALLTERVDENERFYAAKVGVADLLDRKARSTPREMKILVETIKAAQGDADVDQTILLSDPAPGDVEHARPDHIFGIPDGDDPDPYGVHALEMSGLEIREAGSKSRPTSEQFEYRPSPTSPVYQTFHHRRSLSSLSARARERESYARRSVDRCTQTVNMSTQTPDELMHDLAEVVEDERIVEEEEEEVNQLSRKHEGSNYLHDYPPDRARDVDQDLNAAEAVSDHDTAPHLEQDIDQDAEVVEAVVQIQAQAATQVLSRARLVTIGKRSPPALPTRSPARPKVVTVGPETSSNIDGEHRRSDASIQSLLWTTTTTSDARVGAGSDAGRHSPRSPNVSPDRSSQSTEAVSTPSSLHHQVEGRIHQDARIEPDDEAGIHLHQNVRIGSEDQVVDGLLHEPIKMMMMMIKDQPSLTVDDHVMKTTTTTTSTNVTDLPTILPSLLSPPTPPPITTLAPLSIGNSRDSSTTLVQDGILA